MTGIYIASSADFSLATDEAALVDGLKAALAKHPRCVAENDPESSNLIIMFERWSTKFEDYTEKLQGEPFLDPTGKNSTP